VEASPEAKAWLLAQAGIEPSTGARPLRRTIQRHIQDAVSEILIAQQGEQVEGIAAIEVTVEGDELRVRARDHETVSRET
jgi:ATP-dependent Clp protease ATP-binding subunit ClpA